MSEYCLTFGEVAECGFDQWRQVKPFASKFTKRRLLVILLRFCQEAKTTGKITAVLRRKEATNFCSRREAVLKGRHRSHHSGGFTTDGEAHEDRNIHTARARLH